jgi:hypothetical protein
MAVLAACIFCGHLRLGAQQWGYYTFYSTQNGTTAVIIDTNNTVCHTWSFSSSAKTGYTSYLLEGGVVIRSVTQSNSVFGGGGITGRFQKVDWNNTVLWNYIYSTTTYCAHHDFCPMPNGNILVIAYELKSASQAIQAGSKYSHTMWPDKIVEIQPSGSSGGNIVWEWHVWDHLVQDWDATKLNYGVVADHPELINLNYMNTAQTSDWMHCNGIDYNPQLDQIVFSSHNLNELYVIDHSTTTAQAASHSGGNSGRGGDILYRWGNPIAYNHSGTTIFHVVHDAHWIPKGYPNAFSIVAFNNNGISNSQSCVDRITPPYSHFEYSKADGRQFLPLTYNWRHACSGHTSDMGTSQQLPNGNSLVTITQSGYIYEINPAGTTIWYKQVSGIVPNAVRYPKSWVPAEETLIPPGQQNEGSTLTGMAPGIAEKISIFPNPVTDVLHVEGNLPAGAVLIISDMSGREILRVKNPRTIRLSGIEKGLYLYSIRLDQEVIKNGKILLISPE